MFRFGKTECHKVREMLSPYIDGQVKPRERAQVEAHLEQCRACREALDSLEMTLELLRSVPEVSPPRSFALPRAVAERRGFVPAPQLGWLRPATVVVTIVLLAVFAGDVMQLFEPEPVPVATTLVATPTITPTPVPAPTPTPMPIPAPFARAGEEGVLTPTEPTTPAEETEDGGSRLLEATPPGEEPPAEKALPAEEATPPPGAVWLRPLEFALLGLVLLLVGLTVFTWWRRREREVT